MIQIRCGVFETNSSSVHSFHITTDEEYKKLEQEKLLLYRGWRENRTSISYDEAVKKLKEEVPEKDIDNLPQDEIFELLYEYDIAETITHYFEDEYLQSYEHSFITPSGDHMVLFGKYGNDY